MPDNKTDILKQDHPKPNLHRRLFWEFDYDKIDWNKSYSTIIERILERGTKEEWDELISFYGKEKVVYSLKKEINYLPDEVIVDVCEYFNLKPIEIRCYIRKQSLPRHWI